ncbi:MAG: putative ABC transporter permease [Roseburia sp.]|nr:putative ABC transporter permease [Roseburia sp.]MCM1099020.1 putative ABC transporter permease [Ruminococcus flavefaciens]
MSKNIARYFNNFLKCGLTGWCMEILFTAADSLRRRDLTLKGATSLWMFPIYGSAALLAPVSRLLRKKPFWLRGLTYMSLIFSVEYLTGLFLTSRKLCPWDYGKSRWNVRRVIRLDYAPYWFGAGLLFERLLSLPHMEQHST